MHDLVIVDDEAGVRALLSDYLALNGLRVRAASGGPELDACLAAEPADLIVLDLGLPGMDGIEVARQLRRDEDDTPILMLTARDALDSRVEGLDVGADGTWEDRGGLFTVGTALEIDALLEAGIDRSECFIAATDGDNTNLVIAQVAQRRYGVEKVVVRVLDPARARWYEEQGLQTVCPTQIAIELLERAVGVDI